METVSFTKNAFNDEPVTRGWFITHVRMPLWSWRATEAEAKELAKDFNEIADETAWVVKSFEDTVEWYNTEYHNAKDKITY